MNLLDFHSHGPNSSLERHINEVCLAGSTPDERLAIACHDLGKAWSVWQTFIKAEHKGFGCLDHWIKTHPAEGIVFDPWYKYGEKNNFTYRHERPGALISFFYFAVIERNYRTALISLLINDAHHGNLNRLGDCNHLGQVIKIAYAVDWLRVFKDPSFNFFCVEYLKTKGVSESQLKTVMDIITNLLIKKDSNGRDTIINNPYWFTKTNPVFGHYLKWLKGLAGVEKAHILMKVRNLLGMLVWQDHFSASGINDGKTVEKNFYSHYTPSFKERSRNPVFDKQKAIDVLRDQLSTNALALAEKDATFYLLPAPTGLGKTLSFIKLGERLVERYKLSGIVIAAPTIAINAQTHETLRGDLGADSLQLWNYSQRDSTENEGGFLLGSEEERANGHRDFDNPFLKSYNVTTFNQVVGAMIDNHRDSCVKGLFLQNKVIILDEFHKFNDSLLPYVFRILDLWAKTYNCKIILASATPFDVSLLTDKDVSIASLDQDWVREVFANPIIDNRRSYTFIGRKDSEEISNRINEIHKGNESLLVVCNLVGNGTRSLYGSLDIVNPWTVLNNLQTAGKSRAVVIMDGLTPKGVRKEIIAGVGERLKKGLPVTLISTSMIEVGVDLDFDRALIDWMGLNSVVQRGGRVNRNGTKTTCQVEVFSHLVEDKEGHEKNSSWEILYKLTICKDRRGSNIDKNLKDLMWDNIRGQEMAFNNMCLRSPSQTDFSLVKIFQEILSKMPKNSFIEPWNKLLRYEGECGSFNFENCRLIADIYGNDEYGEDYLLFPSKELAKEFQTSVDNKALIGLAPFSKERDEYVRKIKNWEAEAIVTVTSGLDKSIEEVFAVMMVDEKNNILRKELRICWPK